MENLTVAEFAKITKNTCPDCGEKGKLQFGPSGCGSQNIICGQCKMRFNVGMGSGERIGKEEHSKLDPISIPEGTLSWSKHNDFEYLTHSCGGGVNLHAIDDELAAVVCGKCQMRLLVPNQEIKDFDINSYKLKELFAYLSTERPWEREFLANDEGSIAELEDLIDDIYCRFPLEDVIAATKKHIAFLLRNDHLKPEYRKELDKYLVCLTFGLAREFSLDDN